MARRKYLNAPVGGCTVRMYRVGLGDCFLLAFRANKQRRKYVLIDCGVLLGSNDATNTMRSVVKDIRQVTGGHLSALVVTHEHWDHVSGFLQAEEEFKKITVDQVWLAWTENPSNPLAHELRERRRIALQGLHDALADAGDKTPFFTQRIQSLTDFYGLEFGVAGRMTTEKAFDFVKQQWGTPRYLKPGQRPLIIEGLPDVRFFVLGPPEDASYIRKSRPSSHGGQVYLDDPNTGELGLYLSALGRKDNNIRREKYTPFNAAYHVDTPEDTVLNNQPLERLRSKYNWETWRQINMDWAGAAGELALRLDAHTNNTSLVLAVELAPNNKVLLFPGDAQVGNWLSWDSVKWTGEYHELTAKELLSRTVLYKVGHHGSHNATLREKGLERMTNEDLAAMIPVDRQVAKKRRWRMPHEPLYERLNEMTLGRIILTDSGLPEHYGNKIVKDFRNNFHENQLFFDYSIEQ